MHAERPKPEPRRAFVPIAGERANILVAGITGVGKSTLINTMLGAEVAPVGKGRPVTMTIAELSRPSSPLTFFDTRGLELALYAETIAEVEALVLGRAREADPSRHIHLAWLCISEGSRRVEEGESKLAAFLAKHVPVVVVITKARSDRGFSRVVRQLVPEASHVLRVRAMAEVDDEGHALRVRGVEELVAATLRLLPEGRRRAAQRVAAPRKRERAAAVLATFTAAATRVAAKVRRKPSVPVPAKRAPSGRAEPAKSGRSGEDRS